MRYKTMTITTTLNRLLKQAGACQFRYAHLISALGGISFDHDAPINLLTVLGSNGTNDVAWVLENGATIEDSAPAWAEYERVSATALAEYERVRAPALAEYQRVKATALAEILKP
jgi:hypothetical protein